jgi:hypothetical protein
MCTINASLQLALCVVTALSALSILAGSVKLLRHRTVNYWAIVIACLLCLVADSMQLIEPALVMWADVPTLTALKSLSGFLLSDVVLRFTFLKYRTYHLANASPGGGPRQSAVIERAQLRRTRAEIAAALCVFVASMWLGLSSSSTRMTGVWALGYWAIAPAAVAHSILISTREVLVSLAFLLEQCPGGETALRVDLARQKAVTIRNITVSCYAVTCPVFMCALLFLPYTTQYTHVICEALFAVAMVGCAVNQRAQQRIRRRHSKTSMASSRVLGAPGLRTAGSVLRKAVPL